MRTFNTTFEELRVMPETRFKALVNEFVEDVNRNVKRTKNKSMFMG